MGALRTTGMSTLDRVSSRPLPVHEFATEQETRPTQTDRKRSALAKRKLCDTNTSARESDGRPASDEVMDTHSRATREPCPPPREPWGAPARDGTSHINGTRARARTFFPPFTLHFRLRYTRVRVGALRAFTVSSFQLPRDVYMAGCALWPLSLCRCTHHSTLAAGRRLWASAQST